jgi:hypothetical protein
MIEGKQLSAGKYGFFVAYQPDYCTLIFSKATSSWGSYFYEPDEDVLRVNVKPVALMESRERLTFQFGAQTDSSAVISLEWEKLGVPFKVSTRLHELQMASFDKELKGEKGFDPHALVQAVDARLPDSANPSPATGLALPSVGRKGVAIQSFQAGDDALLQVQQVGANDQGAHRSWTGLASAGRKPCLPA